MKVTGSADIDRKAATNIVRCTDANYLATPAVAAYFDAREYEAYYRALKTNEQRRDLHERIILVLERFIDLTDSADGSRTVDEVMSVRGAHSVQSGLTSLLSEAHAQCPDGVKLLVVQEPVTFETLKEAYRTAARCHHPDAGGSHEAMIAVNEAFSVLHKLLRDRLLVTENEAAESAPDQITSCADYRYLCGELLFRVSLDDWSVDIAAAWLARITSPAWQKSRYARGEEQRLELAEPASRLAERLAIAGRIDEARSAFEVAKNAVRLAARKRLRYEHYLRGAEAVFSGSKRWRVVIKHPRQADNARRLNVIDERRYKKLLDEYATAAAEACGRRKSDAQRLRTFQESGGFISGLPTDDDAAGKTAKSYLVPEPNYYNTRIPDLTDDQQAEYSRAFSSMGSLDLGRKYLFVRLTSLLESVLRYPNRINATRAFDEAVFLETLYDASHYDVATTIQALAGENMNEREARAALVDAIEVAGEESLVVLALAGRIPPSLGSPLSQQYMRSILRPLSDLEAMLERGRFPESAARD